MNKLSDMADWELTRVPWQRKGEAIMNFLQWLKEEKGLFGYDRCADIFYLEDRDFRRYWNQFVKKHLKGLK